MSGFDLTESGATSDGGGGGGDVAGPAVAADNALARYDGTTGKLLQSSAITASDAGALAGVTSVGFTASSGALAWVGGVGPSWTDVDIAVAARHDVQNLGATRTYTWPDVSGTIVAATATGTTVGAAGAASALPAAPLGYITIALPTGTLVKIPYYTA